MLPKPKNEITQKFCRIFQQTFQQRFLIKIKVQDTEKKKEGEKQKTMFAERNHH